MTILKETNVKSKHFVYNHYWWFLILAIVFSVVFFSLKGFELKSAMPILIAQLSVFYFLQKQQMEEMKLFREIFTECNDRYYDLSNELELILGKTSLEHDDEKILVSYFNLCGEEYIYYKRGYIYPSVWESWHNGMKYYMDDVVIKEFWVKESESNSYYGLKM
ncbi:MAG: hypothetical protein QM504_12960 [Pseudomonadota bacterium]